MDILLIFSVDFLVTVAVEIYSLSVYRLGADNAAVSSIGVFCPIFLHIAHHASLRRGFFIFIRSFASFAVNFVINCSFDVIEGENDAIGAETDVQKSAFCKYAARLMQVYQRWC